MKVLFLDIDGVLNREGTKARIKLPKYAWTCGLDEELLARFLKWREGKDFYIVLSSMWRYHDDLLEYLREEGVEFIDITERGGGFGALHDTIRGVEVANYLQDHPEVTKYAIVDDVKWFLPYQEPFIVYTDPDTGITEDDLKKLDSILDF